MPAPAPPALVLFPGFNWAALPRLQSIQHIAVWSWWDRGNETEGRSVILVAVRLGTQPDFDPTHNFAYCVWPRVS